MTLPYSRFPLQRALTGIKAAGYRYVAWGTTHRGAGGKRARCSPPTPRPTRRRSWARRCRDLGLEPLMMFSGIYPRTRRAWRSCGRIRQAAAGGVPQVLTFGHTPGAIASSGSSASSSSAPSPATTA